MNFPQIGPEVGLISEGTSAFGFKLFNELTQPGSNAVLSAFSVASILSLASTGAKGPTLSELKAVLALPQEKESLLKGYSSITSRLSYMNIANGIFPGSQFSFHQQFVGDAETHFSSKMMPVNYSDPYRAATQLNDWVSSATDGRINDLIHPNGLSPNTHSVLINAIFFKGSWANRFESELTTESLFHVSQGVTRNVPTMFGESEIGHDFSEDLNAHIIGIPFQEREIMMYLLLPKERFGLEDLESKLANGFSSKMIPQMLDFKKRELRLPLFKIESTHDDLKKALQRLGITHLFRSGSCDLSGMAAENLYVSDVMQKAVIEVNEEGSEASAGTMMGINAVMALETQTISVDHPFAFFIRDEGTGVILFMGRVVDP